MATLGPRASRHVVVSAFRVEDAEVTPLLVGGDDITVWTCAAPLATEGAAWWTYRDARGAREGAARLAAACAPDLRDTLTRSVDLLAELATSEGVCGVRLEAGGRTKAMMCGPVTSPSRHVVLREECLLHWLGVTRATASHVEADAAERAFAWVCAAMAVGAAWALSAA